MILIEEIVSQPDVKMIDSRKRLKRRKIPYVS
jgi:hypothetical protein